MRDALSSSLAQNSKAYRRWGMHDKRRPTEIFARLELSASCLAKVNRSRSFANNN